MVEFLAHARNDEYWCVPTQPIRFSKSKDPFRICNKDERYSLAETGARIVLSQFQYSTNLGFWDWDRFERAYHPPLADHSSKFHERTVR